MRPHPPESASAAPSRSRFHGPSGTRSFGPSSTGFAVGSTCCISGGRERSANGRRRPTTVAPRGASPIKRHFLNPVEAPIHEQEPTAVDVRRLHVKLLP